MEHLTTPGDKNNMEAVLHVSALANREMYEKMRRDPGMNEPLKKILFGDEIDREIEEAADKRAQIIASRIAQEMAQEIAQEMAQKIAQEMAQKIAQEMLQKMLQEAVQETEKETLKETEKKTIEKLLKKGKMSIEEIAECCTGFSEQEIREIEADLKQTV